MSAPSKPSIVFCHGLWADGSCFIKLIPSLQADGHQVIAAQYGLDTPEGDVETVIRALGRVNSPAILVGQSYGGSVITAAGTDDRVAGLVYIAALAPDADETSQTLQDKFPTTDVFGHIEVADGRIWLLPDGIDCFAGDLPEAEKQLVCDPVRARRGPVQSQRRRCGVALQAQLVHPRHPGPHGAPGAGALRRRAHGRHDLQRRLKPRPHALPPRRSARCHPHCRRRGARIRDRRSRLGGAQSGCAMT